MEEEGLRRGGRAEAKLYFPRPTHQILVALPLVDAVSVTNELVFEVCKLSSVGAVGVGEPWL